MKDDLSNALICAAALLGGAYLIAHGHEISGVVLLLVLRTHRFLLGQE